MGRCWGIWGGGSFTGTFERKSKYLSWFIYWKQMALKVKSGGQLEHGCPELISDHGAQMDRL